MSESGNSRAIGAIIVLVGGFLIGLNGFLALKNGEFYGMAAIIGPLATCYGLSVIIRPPAKMPPTELAPFYSRFLGLGACLGVAYLLLLRFVDLRELFK